MEVFLQEFGLQETHTVVDVVGAGVEGLCGHRALSLPQRFFV
jgi:hypothetical protein